MTESKRARAQPSAMPADARELLRAYFTAAVLMEPIQLELWQDASLTLTQLRILYVLREASRNAADLAHIVSVDPASLTRVLDRMVERGLVQRKQDDRDRRRLVISVTAEGLGLLGEHPVLRGTRIDHAVRAMSPAERETVRQALDLLVERVEVTTVRPARRVQRDETGARPQPRRRSVR